MQKDSPSSPDRASLASSPDEPETTFITHVRKMKSIVSYLVLSIAGSLLLMSPVVILLWMQLEALPNLVITDEKYLNSVNQNLMRFSLFFTSVWNIWLLFWFLLRIAPYLVKKIIQTTNGYVSEVLIQRLEYIPAIHPYLVATATIIFAIPIYGILFAQMAVVPPWQTVFNVLILLLVFSVVLLIQRILVQKIAFDFYRIAYNDRIHISKHEMKIIDQLKKAIKKINLMHMQHPVDESVSDKDKNQEGASINPLHFVKKSIKVKKDGHSVDFKRLSGELSPASTGKKHSHSMSLPVVLSEPVVEPVAHLNSNPGHSHEKDSILSKKDLENIEKGLPLSNDDFHDPSSMIADPVSTEGISPEVMIPAVNTDFTSVNMVPTEGRTSEVGLQSLDLGIQSNEMLASTPAAPSPVQPDAKSISSSLSTGNQLQIGVGGKARRKRYLEFSGEADARKLAKHIYMALLKSSHAPEVTVETFYPYFTADIPVETAFTLFDKDRNGTISLREMQTTIMRIFKDRRNLSESMSDLSHALGQLNQILYGISFFVTLLLSLPIFGVSLTSVIPLTSFFLGLSFIFSGVAQQTFAAIIFIFVTHPYDSGDKIMIDEKTYIVVELSLLITTLKQEGKLVYVPNSQLALKSIYNIRRSGDQSEMIKVQVSIDTPDSTMQVINEKMIAFMKSQPARFKGSGLMDLSEFGPGQCCTYSFLLEYAGNWQDGVRRMETKFAYMAALKKNLEEHKVKLYHPYTKQ